MKFVYVQYPAVRNASVAIIAWTVEAKSFWDTIHVWLVAAHFFQAATSFFKFQPAIVSPPGKRLLRVSRKRSSDWGWSRSRRARPPICCAIEHFHESFRSGCRFYPSHQQLAERYVFAIDGGGRIRVL